MRRRTPLQAAPLLLLLLALVGCDTGGPGEPDEPFIQRLRLALVAEDGSLASAQALFDEDGRLVEVDTLVLDPRATYTGTASLFSSQGNSFNERSIGPNPEEYLLRYVVRDLPVVTWTITDRESDYAATVTNPDLEVGLAFDVAVDVNALQETQGVVDVRLERYDTAVKGGQSGGDEVLFEAAIPVRVDVPLGPGALGPITEAGIRLGPIGTSTGGFTSIDNPDGLTSGDRAGNLVLRGGAGLFALDLEELRVDGQNVTDVIAERGDYYRFELELPEALSDFVVIVPGDEDLLGRPVGLTTYLQAGLPPSSEPADVRIRGYRYDPAAGASKDDPGSGELILDIVFGLSIQ